MHALIIVNEAVLGLAWAAPRQSLSQEHALFQRNLCMGRVRLHVGIRCDIVMI